MSTNAIEPQCDSYRELNSDLDYPLPNGKIPLTPEEYGKRIMELREKSGLTQQELGNLIGITPQAISKIEFGKLSVNLEYMKEFSKIFNCTTHYLAGYTDDPLEVSVDGVRQKISMALYEYSSVCTLNLFLLRVRTDPETFDLFSKLCECPKRKRGKIKQILSILLSN